MRKNALDKLAELQEQQIQDEAAAQEKILLRQVMARLRKEAERDARAEEIQRCNSNHPRAH